MVSLAGLSFLTTTECGLSYLKERLAILQIHLHLLSISMSYPSPMSYYLYRKR